MPDEATHEAPALDPELRRQLDAQRDERIFVEIASVHAGDVLATAASAIDNAVRPDRLRFGIAARQGDDADGNLLWERRNDPRFSIGHHPRAPDAGRQWLRHRAQSFYDGEPFILQLDGAARCSPDWDARYLELLRAVDVERPLLTDAPLPRTRPGARPPTPFDALDRLAPHRFTVGRFAIDVPHDPEDRGDDDVRVAVRAYTHGYDAVLPSVPLVLCADEDRPPDDDNCERTIVAVVASLMRSPIGGTDELGTRRTIAALDRLLRER